MVKAWSKPVIWLPEPGVPGGSMKPSIFDGSINPMVSKSHTVLVEPDQLTLEWLKVLSFSSNLVTNLRNHIWG